jgi:hypothetical protein
MHNLFLKHKAALVGAILALPGAWSGFKWLLDWGGRIDVFRSWGASLIDLITNAPPWLNLLLVLAGITLIWWDLKRNPVFEAVDTASPQVSETNAVDLARAELNRLRADQIQTNQSLSNMIGSVGDKADKIALNAQADIKGMRESIRLLGERVENAHQLTGQGQLRLRNAILARNAHDIVKQQDAKATDLAGRLLSGVGYDTQTWLTDYREWKDALSTIDLVVSEWQKDRASLLDVRAREMEHVRDMPPSNLDRDRTTTQFKTLCIVNERYLDSRTDILNYFATKAADL